MMTNFFPSARGGLTRIAACGLLAATLLAACSSAAPTAVGATQQAADKAASPIPGTTATRTPFPPATATATPVETPIPLPTPVPTFDPSQPWGSFAAPVQQSAIEIPPPADPIPFDGDVVNILVLGSDARPYEPGYRTDVIMVVSLDPSEGTATLFSVPRDLYVYLPGWSMDRINTADPRGGPEMAFDTFLYNFGIPIHHYVRVNFQGYMNFIDALGGLDVEVTASVYDKCGRNWYRYSPGTYHMDGFTSLCYVRMRKNTSDFDRLRRQQEVIQAIFSKVLSLDGLTKAPELYEQFKGLFQTDMPLDQALRLLPLATHLAQNRQDIHQLTIDSSMAPGWRVPYSGAAVLLPDRAKIQSMLESSFGS
jgi:LCP family protein required for cell wall assembly